MIDNSLRGFKHFLLPTILWWIIAISCLFVFSQYELFYFFNAMKVPGGDIWIPFLTMFGEGTLIIPIALILFCYKKYRKWTFLLFIILALSLPPIITAILKSIVGAPRPLNLYNNAEWIHVVEGYKNNRNRSFPSGHTTGVFALFSFLCMLLPKKRAWLAWLYFIVALMTGFSRLYLAQHFFEDIVAGSIVGTAVVYFIYLGMRNNLIKNNLIY